MKYLLPLISLLFLSSCEDKIDDFDPDVLPNKYSYNLIIQCYCPVTYVGPHRVEITNGEVTNYEFIGTEDPLDDVIGPEDYDMLSLPNLQQRAKQIIDENPHSQTIEYHPDYNFIASAYFDIDERIADEEWGFVITEFEVK